MIIKTIVFASIFSLVLGETKPFSFDSSHKEIIAEHIYNSDECRGVQKGLGELQKANEKLEQKIESMNIMLSQQHTILRSELKEELKEIKIALKNMVVEKNSNNPARHTIHKRELYQTDSEDIRITLKSNAVVNNQEQHTRKPRETKNDKTETQLTLKTVISNIKLDKQAAIKQNRLNSDMEELKLKLLSKIISENRAHCKSIHPNSTSTETSTKTKTTTTSATFPTITPTINSSTNPTTPRTITTKQRLPANYTIKVQSGNGNGLCKIQFLNSKLQPFDAYCLTHADDNDDMNPSPWIVIQRRVDGSVDFYRNWNESQQGFGNLTGEFFIGLDKLYALTQSTSHQLWIEMEDFNGIKRWAKYDSFGIAGESDGYALNVLGSFTGNAEDALSRHKSMKWTTTDVDNDEWENGNCAELSAGSWWFTNCFESHLNGRYLHPQDPDFNEKGIYWYDGGSLKYVQMAISPSYRG